jgi:hypothetical protein
VLSAVLKVQSCATKANAAALTKDNPVVFENKEIIVFIEIWSN